MVRSFDQVSIVLLEHFQLFPSIPHAVERNVGGIAEIIIPELVPYRHTFVASRVRQPIGKRLGER
jgi:hypothetical protein